ncbi:MAG: hypothetical protein NZU63_14245 [Gemmataceae bacterium]|nr:hypothetical protein [Gemmataceae bacterium]
MAVAEGSPDDSDESHSEPDVPLVLALIAMILVGVAALATQFPYGRYVGLGVSICGALVGLITLGAEGRARWYAAVAAVGHAILLVLLLFVPEWLRLEPAAVTEEVSFSGPVAWEHGTQRRTPLLTPDQWVDASYASWEYRGIRVTVANVVIGPLEFHGSQHKTRTPGREQYLQLTLQVTHTGMEQLVELSQWALGEPQGITLRDSSGKTIPLARLPEGWSVDRGQPLRTLMPGLISKVRFIFTAPPQTTGNLQLELNGKAVGLPEQTIRFRLTPSSGRLGATLGPAGPLPQPPGGGFAGPGIAP